MRLFTRLWAPILSAWVLSACNTPSLENTQWALQSMDGQPVLPHHPATLAFLPEGQVGGSASCNRYFGQFTQTDPQLQVRLGGVTKMWCHSEQGNVMTQEDRFLQALSMSQRFSWDGDALLIYLADSTAPLRFVPVKP